MKFFLETKEQFAARRRKAQDQAVESILSLVKDAIADPSKWTNELAKALIDLWFRIYEEEAGEPPKPEDARVDKIVAALEKWLKENATDSSSPSTTALALATSIINDASIAAITDDEDELAMEWVTMHDTAVRDAHKETDGQKRLVGDKFDVAGVPMVMPGDVTAPIELWINCRCSVRPTLISDEFQSNEGTAMTTTMDGPLGYATSTGTATNTTITLTTTEEPTEEFVTDLIPWHGVLAPEGVMSGDGRQFAPDSLSFRDLPLPLTYQKSSDDGHKGSVTVGSIETIERKDGLMEATGYFLSTEEADEVIGLLAHFGRYGVSVDADDAEFEYDDEHGTVLFSKARIAAASIVGIPAFAEAFIMLGPWEEALAASAQEFIDVAPGKTEDGPGWLTHPVDTDRLRDYWVRGPGAAKIGWGTPGDFNRCRVNLAEYVKPQYLSGYCANRHYDALGFWPGDHASAETIEGDPAPAITLVADASIKAPAAWFKDPRFTKPTHLQVTEEGRVFGHIAEWGVCHIGINGVCTEAPTSPSDYGYYANKSVLLDDGTFARTGVIQLAGKHAPGHLSPRATTQHYDDTTKAVADVCTGEDEHGIWCAGWIRPGTPEENVVALRASDISGDWRKIAGELDMVAALAVNAGGFPVRVAASNGEMISLVAAGVIHEDDNPQPDYDKIGEALAAAMERRQARREKMAALSAEMEEGGQ